MGDRPLPARLLADSARSSLWGGDILAVAVSIMRGSAFARTGDVGASFPAGRTVAKAGFLRGPVVRAHPWEGMTTLAKRPYEAVLILNPNVGEEELAATQERVLNQIALRGGEVTRVDAWGRRRMFYPIKHSRDGHYLVCHFTAEAPAIKLIETQWLIADGLLRHLVIRLDEA